MYKGIELSASLMCIDWMRAGEQLSELEGSGIDFLHYDVIDGSFAPDFTMGSSIINRFRESTTLKSDYHLMVEEPNRLLASFDVGGQDFLTIHQECARNLHRDLVKIRQLGGKVGVALSPGTSLEVLEYVIEDVDLVLLMTVNPGFMGQPLIPQAIRKIEKLKKLVNDSGLNVCISVDGCVKPETIPEIIAAGADRLVLGSSGLFLKNKSISDAMNAIELAIDMGINRRNL